jgi:hypothetical protein
MEAENKKSFSSLDDGKYDHFAYVMVKKKTAQPSLQSVLNRNVGFFESFTFGGDPREFNSPGDFNSGPSFRFRTFLAIVPDLPSGVQHPLTPSQQKVSWKDLESGRLRVLGRLSEQLGTVMECHCRIANDRRSLVISTSKIKEKVFNRTHVIFKKLGCVVEWKYVETNLDEFDSVCYERVDCIAIPKLVRDALDIGGDATNDVRPTDFLVVKIPASINLPGYDIELPTSP